MLNVIYLDMDGVIVDLVRHTYRIAGIAEAEIDAAFHDTTEWDSLPRVLSEFLQTEWTESDLYELWATGGQKFWATVPWTTHGKALYNLCSQHAPVVLMTTPTIRPSSAAGKMDWIQRNMPQHAQRHYALAPPKHMMAHPGAILIDDGEHNIDKFAAKGETFLWPGPWNRNSSMSHDDAMAALSDKLRELKER